jgi:hypothetical protein
MITGFSSEDELDLDVPGPMGGKYIRREGFVKVSKPVREVPDDIFLRSFGFCCFGKEYIDIFI